MTTYAQLKDLVEDKFNGFAAADVVSGPGATQRLPNPSLDPDDTVTALEWFIGDEEHEWFTVDTHLYRGNVVILVQHQDKDRGESVRDVRAELDPLFIGAGGSSPVFQGCALGDTLDIKELEDSGWSVVELNIPYTRQEAAT